MGWGKRKGTDLNGILIFKFNHDIFEEPKQFLIS